jgi:signal recognition particle subunit SRP54
MKVDANTKPGEQFISLLASELVDTMGKEQAPLMKRGDGRPNVILLAGLQGAGKTTAVGKLAKWALTQKYSSKLLLVAADIYRPAAIEQLQTLGAKVGVDVYTEGKDVSPVQISRRALAKAIAEQYDTVIIDTAGRQIVDDRLMDELRQIKAAVTPDEVLLVVDAMIGQEAAILTSRFNDDIGITGAILTKMDGDTRGGSALSIRGVSGKPIKFVGVGEGLDDLEPFYPDRMASRILGMGDIKTFIEKAQDIYSKEQAAEVARKMQKGSFDFNDMLKQLQQVKKLGGMNALAKMIPGMANKLADEQLFEAERKTKQVELIISAMTDEERSNPDLLTRYGGKKELLMESVNRRREIAKNVGLTERDIDSFMSDFLRTRKMMSFNMKGLDINKLEGNPDTMIPIDKEPTRRDKKLKPSRGGGSGFGSR